MSVSMIATRAPRAGVGVGRGALIAGADRRGDGVARFFGEMVVVEVDEEGGAPDVEQRQGG
jgi:hypothetical protein